MRTCLHIIQRWGNIREFLWNSNQRIDRIDSSQCPGICWTSLTVILGRSSKLLFIHHSNLYSFITLLSHDMSWWGFVLAASCVCFYVKVTFHDEFAQLWAPPLLPVWGRTGAWKVMFLKCHMRGLFNVRHCLFVKLGQAVVCTVGSLSRFRGVAPFIKKQNKTKTIPNCLCSDFVSFDFSHLLYFHLIIEPEERGWQRVKGSYIGDNPMCWTIKGEAQLKGHGNVWLLYQKAVGGKCVVAVKLW